MYNTEDNLQKVVYKLNKMMTEHDLNVCRGNKTGDI